MSSSYSRGRIGDIVTQNRKVITIQSFILLILSWQIATIVFDLHSVISSPRSVSIFTYELIVSLEWVPHLADSLRRIFIGFASGMILGMLIALLMGFTNFWEAVVKDYVVLGLSLPTLLAVVFAAMYFGHGDKTPIAAAVAMSTPYNAQIIYEGIKDVEDDLVNMGKAFNLNRRQSTQHIVLPSLLPDVFSAARLSFAGCWKIVTLGEFIAAGSGLGFMLQHQLIRLSMEGLLGWTLLFVTVILIVEYGVFRTVEKKLFEYREEVAGAMGGG